MSVTSSNRLPANPAGNHPQRTTAAESNLTVTLAMHAGYATVILDDLTAVTVDGVTDLTLGSWLTQGFALAAPDSLPPRLSAGWHLRLAHGRLVGLAMADAWCWCADPHAIAADVPGEWLAVARARAEIIVLAGRLALAGDSDLGFEPVPPSRTMTVVSKAMSRGRIASAIVGLVETR